MIIWLSQFSLYLRKVFIKRGSIVAIKGKLGVGKESDIYKCVNEKGEIVVLKLAR